MGVPKRPSAKSLFLIAWLRIKVSREDVSPKYQSFIRTPYFYIREVKVSFYTFAKSCKFFSFKSILLLILITTITDFADFLCLLTNKTHFPSSQLLCQLLCRHLHLFVYDSVLLLLWSCQEVALLKAFSCSIRILFSLKVHWSVSFD